MLACFALPQQAAAQNSIDFLGSTFTISDADPVNEGDTARFTVTIEPPSITGFGGSIIYNAGSADLEDLGSGRPTLFSYNTGDTSGTIEVPIAADGIAEGEETFRVVIVFAAAGTIQATGTINASVAAPPAVDISIAPASATEGGDIRFPVTLSTALLEARTLDIGYTAGSGNTGAGLDDLGSDRPTTLTLPTGTTTVNLVVPTVDENDDENDETFTVTLSLPDRPASPMNTLNITTGSAIGTINDNDETPDAEVSIANASVAENAAAGAIGFTVSLDRAAESDVTLAVAYAAVTATLGTDLGTRPATVTIDEGQTEATLTVPVTNDDTVEGNETFTVTLSEGATPLPDGVTIGADNAATGTITDADTAGVSLSATDPPAASEGGTITFTVNLDNPVAETFNLGWAASDGTATVEDDLDDQSGTVEIAANARTATFTIPVTNDTDIEGSETFTVALTGAPTGLVNIATNRVTVDRASATGTINASDQANTVTIGNRSVAENVSGGSIGFTVSLTRAVDSDVTLAVAYAAGTATLDDDLGTPLPPSVTITEGTTSATLAVPIADEVLVEGDETFTVTLSEDPASPLPEGVEIGNGTATGTIANDDEAEIRTNVSEVNETGVSLTFRPGVTAPLAQDLALAWEVTGGTASAADFIRYAGSGTVTIPARQNSAPILFFPRDDDLVEGSETLTLTFSPAPGTTLPDGVTFGRTTATAMIADSDEAVIDLRLVADVSETDARLTFRPVLSRRLTQDVTLSWEVTGGTASADDFSEYAGSGTVTIDAGRGGAPIRFFPLDDDAVEGPETLEVTISAALGTLPRGVNLGATTTATATIADDDEAPPAVDIGIANARADEGDNIRFTVTLSEELLEARTLDIGYTAGTGDSGAGLDDLGDDRPTTLTLPAGVTTVNLDVPTVEDTDAQTDEIDETFTVTLSLPDPPDNPANTLTITTATATGTIVDDDAPAGDVVVGIADACVGEGDDSVTLTARLSRTVNQDVMLGITYQDGTATVADDLSGDPAPPRTVRIPANTLSADFTVFIRDDTLDEPDETLTVSLGGASLPPETNFDFSDNSATLTIVDDDDPAPPVNNRVSIVDPQPVSEGAGALNFVVSTQFAVNSDVALGVAYAGGTTDPATPADDLGADRPATVTINAGERRATLRVPIVDDPIVEGNETFTVTLSLPDENPPGHALFLDAGEGEATGAITDNDAGEVTLGPATLEAAENGTFTYTVSLGAAADEAVTVRWTAAAGPGDTATVDDDLQETTDTVTFAANDNTDREFTISPVNDNEDEDNETFTVTLGADGDNPLPTGVTIGTSNSSEGTITDDDDTPIVTGSIRIADADPVAEGAGPARFTITLEPRALTGDVVLDVAYAPGMDTLEADPATLEDLGSTRPATVRIPAGSRDVVLEVPIADDDEDEGREAFTVTISAAEEQPDDPETGRPPDVVLLFPDGNEATGIITDNDDAAPPAPARRLSVLIGPRLIGAGTALRRHVSRFDRMTGTVVRGRLDGRAMKTLTASQDLGSGAVAVGGSFDQDRFDQGHFDQGRWGA